MLSSRSLGGTYINLIIVTVTAAQMLTLSQHNHIPPNTTPLTVLPFTVLSVCVWHARTHENLLPLMYVTFT